MRLRVLASPHDVAVVAADAVEALVRRRPDAVLGVATGSSPLPTYDELARRHAAGGLDLAAAQAFLLDEYVGLAPEHPERYRTVVHRELADRVGLPRGSVHAPDVDAADLEEACRRYEAEIQRAGGVDLQVLGLGTDGHIAFNMPGADPGAGTRVASLTEQTVRDNARFFGGDPDAVPRRVVTQGLRTVLRARALLMVVTGEGKAPALRALLEDPVDRRVPGTALRGHPDATVLADRAAASLLRDAARSVSR